jgi:tRNA modification GTPase
LTTITLPQVVVTDAAGIRDAEDEVEAEGVRRARAAAAAAHVVLSLREPGADGSGWMGAGDAGGAGGKHVLRVLSKADLLPPNRHRHRSSSTLQPLREPPDCEISCATGEGLAALTRRLGDVVRGVVQGAAAAGGDGGGGGGGAAPPPLLLRERHRHHVGAAAAALRRYEAAPAALEVAAEALRAAARALGRVTGAVGTEEVLDSIFAEFCVGK